MMFKIAICDDDKNICCSLEKTVRSVAGEMGLICESEVFYDGQSLLHYLKQSNSFDLIFLDIEMNGMNGITVSEKLRNDLADNRTEIVYVTCTTQYDRKLFDYQPLAFIPKPYHSDQIKRVLSLALKRQNIIAPLFSFTYNRETLSISYKEILYFESEDRRVNIFTEAGSYSYYAKISSVRTALPSFFCQIHRSYIVNLYQISQYSNREVVMKNKQRITVGKNYRDNFLQAQWSCQEKCSQ